jgi:hypothetical protein
MGGFHVQTNDEDFVEDTPRSAATWKRALKRLTELEYLNQVNQEIYELTEEGFARADKEAAISPLEMSVSFAGPPGEQMLSVKANKLITLNQLDFLLSSGANISTMELAQQPSPEAMIPLDYAKIVELFNAPRPDRNNFDHAGPAALRLILMVDGRRVEAVLPILLQPKFVGNTNWIQLVGSKTFTVK